MADQEIKYKVTADTTQAKAAFSDINKQVDGMKDSGESATPSIDKLAGSVKDAGEAAIPATKSIGQMAAIVGGSVAGVGLVLALGAATLAFSAFIYEAVKAKEEINKFKEALDQTIKKLIEFEDPFKNIKFGFKVEDIDKAIRVLDKQITKAKSDINEALLGKGGVTPSKGLPVGLFLLQASGLVDALSVEDRKRFEAQKKLLEAFEDQKYILEAQKIVAEELGDLGGVRVEKLKETKKVLEEITRVLITGGDAANRWAKSMQVDVSGRNKGGRGKVKGGKEEASMTDEFKADMELMDNLIMSTASLLRSEFISAWEDIFGEANSLFEKFMLNIADQLAALAMKNIATGIFGFIAGMFTGGAATAVTAIAAAGGNQPIQNNIIIDGRQLATIYTSGKSNAARLRMG